MQEEKGRSNLRQIGREGSLCRKRRGGATLDRWGEKDPFAGREGEEQP
jgi:hypothetical protein